MQQTQPRSRGNALSDDLVDLSCATVDTMRFAMFRALVLSTCVLVACKGKERPPGEPAPTSPTPTTPTTPAPAKAKPDGPAITPAISNSVTFVVPKSASWWGEFQFSCYRAVMSLTGKNSPGEAFERISPTVPEAMRAGGIDLGRDLAGMGMFECGGSPCIYIAATLEHPEKMKDVLDKLIPNVASKTVAPNHYTLGTASTVNPSGTRTIHVRVVPLDWSATKAPDDAWSKEAARATHVIFIGGVDGRDNDVDPLTLLADAQTAAANVKEAESVLGGETRNRCMLGLVAAREFQPGVKLTRGRFAMAAPPAAKADAMMAMLDSKKTLDVEVELVLAPPPTEAKAKEWIGTGRMFMSGIGANVRGQFTGQGEAMDVYFDLLSLIGEKAFAHSIKDSSLRFSWRTDRIPKADLQTLEKRFEGMFGP